MKVLTALWILFSCGMVLAQTTPAKPAPMGRVEVLGRLMANSMEVTKSERVERLVQQRGLSFNPTDDFLQSVKSAGGSEPLLKALRQAGQNNGSASQPATAAGNNREALAHLERGIKLWDQHKYKDAVKELRAALKIEPDNAYLHLAQSTMLVFKEDKKAAIQEAYKAIKLQPDCPDAHAEVARLLGRSKDSSKGLPEYQEALRLEPGYASVRFAICYTMEHQGNIDGAIKLYREGVRLAPQNAGMHNMLGNALAKKGDTAAAEEQFRLAAALPVDPSVPKRIRVGGQVMSKKLIDSTRPAYPPKAKANGVTGTVRLSVVIGRDGSIQKVAVLSGNPILAKAAVSSVRKWHYRPTTISGYPVEVLTEIDVNFNLE